MKFIPFTYFGETSNINQLPVSDSIFWMDVSIAGTTNLANTTASWVAGTYNEIPPNTIITYTTSSIIVTDSSSSAASSNAINMAGANVYDLDNTKGIGTIVMVYRFVPTGSFNEPNDPCDNYHEQLVTYKIIDSNNNFVSNAFPNNSFTPSVRGLQVSPNYVSGSYYTAYGSNSFTKFTPISSSITSSTILGYPGNYSGVPCDVTVSGSWNQFPGPSSGSGVIHSFTGMTSPKFYAFSPEYMVTGSTNIGIFSQATNPINPRQPGIFFPKYGNNFKNATNILSLAIFDRILNDAEIEIIYLYYKNLGYYI